MQEGKKSQYTQEIKRIRIQARSENNQDTFEKKIETQYTQKVKRTRVHAKSKKN